ncbi:hypothetical protein PIB30_018806 [Stylosanthes scabra]|uniref:Uncharacterized protein n=1 Tax=Stylosanthes scabra TaxID=79078 RepID=A0ABU6S8A5_9FABA|nr:hypothetical protein [Stylosanthes scabra]
MNRRLPKINVPLNVSFIYQHRRSPAPSIVFNTSSSASISAVVLESRSYCLSPLFQRAPPDPPLLPLTPTMLVTSYASTTSYNEKTTTLMPLLSSQSLNLTLVPAPPPLFSLNDHHSPPCFVADFKAATVNLDSASSLSVNQTPSAKPSSARHFRALFLSLFGALPCVAVVAPSPRIARHCHYSVLTPQKLTTSARENSTKILCKKFYPKTPYLTRFPPIPFENSSAFLLCGQGCYLHFNLINALHQI